MRKEVLRACKKAGVLALVVCMLLGSVPAQAFVTTNAYGGETQAEQTAGNAEATDVQTNKNSEAEDNTSDIKTQGENSTDSSASQSDSDSSTDKSATKVRQKAKSSTPSGAGETPAPLTAGDEGAGDGGTEGDGGTDPGEGEGEPAEPRQPGEIPIDDHIKSLTITVTDSKGTDTYSYPADQNIETREIDRNAQLAISLEFNVNECLGNNSITNNNPALVGDEFTCKVPELLSNANGGKWTGRLVDPTTNWGMENGSVGDFTIENGKMIIKFDPEYIEETNGNIKKAALSFNGSFDAFGWDESAFETTLLFGNVPVKVSFPAQTAIRDLSIEKTAVDYGSNAFSTSSNTYGKRQLNGTANVDKDGYITYQIKVTAGEDNTENLTNVIVGDQFGSDNFLPGLTLVKVVKGVLDTDITADVTEKKDDNDNFVGWNIGSLSRGEEATITFKARIDKDKISEDVKDAKDANPQSAAIAERTLKNKGTASADKVPEVTDDESTKVQNYVSITKTAGTYDPAECRKYFTITLTAPEDNKYTQYNVSVRDYLSSYNKAFYVDAGIKSMTITHADGSTETHSADNPLYNNFEYNKNNSNEWIAYINKMEPGDKVTIVSYEEIDPEQWYKLGANTSSSGSNGTSSTYNYAYAANQNYNFDMGYSYSSAYYYLYKQWITKSASTISSDGKITWTATGNAYDSDFPDADITGFPVKDTLGANLEFDGPVTVTFYERQANGSYVKKAYNGENADGGNMVLNPTGNSFEFDVPEGYGQCKFVISYTTNATNNYGPEYTYRNTVGLNHWTYTATTLRPRIATMDKSQVKRGEDWAEWKTKVYGPVAAGDKYTDVINTSTDVMYMTEEQLNDIKITFNGQDVDDTLYEIVPDTVQTGTNAGKIKGFTVNFKGAITSTNGAGNTITPTSANPLNIVYRTKTILPDPNNGGVVNDYKYSNSGTISVNGIEDTDTDFFWRSNRQDISKRLKSSTGSNVTWTVRVNENGESSKPAGYATSEDGDDYGLTTGITTNNELIFTETLPAGLRFVTAKYNSKGSDSRATPTVEVLGVPVINPDGTSTVQIKVSNLTHFECNKNYASTANYRYWHGYVWADVDIVTQIVDQDFLYDTTDKTYTWTNTTSLVTRDGIPFSAQASKSLSHVAMTKDMAYTAGTAPFAQFTLDVNNDRQDLNPDGPMVKIFDKSSSSLVIDTSSIKVVDTSTNKTLTKDTDYILDAGKMAEGIFALEVPDNIPLKITYQAYVSGVEGDTVSVSNCAYFEGQETKETTSRIEKDLLVLNSTASAESDVMIWLKKMDAMGNKLAGATFKLEAYDGESESWVLQKDDIESVGTGYGTKIGGLEQDVLYRLSEKSAPRGYVTDSTPTYFCLKKSQTSNVAIPDDVDQTKIFYCKVAALTNLYNNPYVDVKFSKTDPDGTPVKDADFKVIDKDGNTVLDEDGNELIFKSAESAKEYFVEAGTYTLVEVNPPKGFYKANPITFTVRNDKTITIAGETAANNLVTMKDEKTKVLIQKMNGTGETLAPLAGAKLQILDGEDEVTSWTSTEEAKEITGLLEVGKTYTLHEVTAPGGYLKAGDIEFKLNNDKTITTTADLGENGEIQMVDTKPELKIKKIGTKDNEALSGVKMELLDGDDSVVHTWTSTEDPETIENLDAGKTYTVHEVEGVAHYDKFTDFTVVVNADGTVDISDEDTASYANGVLTVKDTYHPEPAKLAIPVSKTVTGEEVPEDYKETFNFTLSGTDNAPMPAGTGNAISIEGEGKANFGEIEFTKEGTYTYNVNETEGTKNGYIYGRIPHIVKVTVVDEDGVLKASWTLDGEAATEVAYTNEYSPEAATTSIPVQKVISGNARPAGNKKTFQFELTKDASNPNAPMPVNSIISIPDEGEAVIGEIGFTAAGTYKYQIKEIRNTEKGYTYSTEVHNVTVTVTDENNNGILTAAYVVDGDKSKAVFTNEYHPAPAEQPFTAKKVISGNERPDDQEETFTFTIEGKDNAPMPEALPDINLASLSNKLFNLLGVGDDDGTVSGDVIDEGTVDFGSATYTEAGTYEYTIKEEGGNAKGYTYSTDVYTAVVTVTDNDGTLVANTVYKKGNEVANEVVFTNTYEPAPTAVTVPVHKTLTGNAVPENGDKEFHFTLAADADTPDAPMPSGAGNKAMTEGAGDGAFGQINFTKAGTYKYTVTEQAGNDTGYTYSEDEYKVTVVVTDKGGELSNTVTYTKGTETVNKPVFTNNYEPEAADLDLPIEKLISGNARPEGNEKDFTFTLEGKDNAPMPAEGGETVVITDEDAAKFGTITYTEAGTYNYTVTEAEGTEPGYRYDTNVHRIQVVVTDNDGVLETAWTMDGKTVDDISITNSYKPAATSLVIPVSKVLDGEDIPEGYKETFKFQIESVGDAPTPDSTEVTIKGEGDTAFGAINFTKAGDYQYVIKELTGTLNGYAYDKASHTVAVHVTDNNGVLERTWTLDGVAGGENSKATFSNTYAPSAVFVSIPIEKKVTGHERLPEYLKTFNFELTADPDTPDAPLPANKNAAINDNGESRIGEFVFTHADTYKYILKEKDGKLAGYTYDTAPRNITIVVEDTSGNGELSASYSVETAGVVSTEKTLVFTNEYHPKKASEALSVEKVINGNDRPESTKQFTFTLKGDTDSTPMPKDGTTTTVATDEETVDFSDIEYTHSGTYKYTITEQGGNETGYTYSKEKYKAVVEVTDNDGELVAETTYTKDGTEVDHPVFTNTYTPVPVNYAVTVQKAFSDDSAVRPDNKTFKFELYDEEGAKLDTKTTSGSGTVSFKSIKYEEAGTYNYTVKEVEGTDTGYTYDTSDHTVAVKVIDDDGTLKVDTVTIDAAAVNAAGIKAGNDKVKITNVYSPDIVNFSIPVTKKVTGHPRDPQNPKTFEFKITGEGDAPVPTVMPEPPTPPTPPEEPELASLDMGEDPQPADTITLLEDESKAFENIIFTRAGTYEYTISETKGSEKGYKYDDTEHKVTVIVRDNNGVLEIAGTKLDGEEITFDAENTVVFTNEYHPLSTDISIPVSKKISGNAQPEKKNFKFEIKGNAPLPAKSTVTVKGAGTSSFGKMSYDEAGTYNYTISEVKGTDAGYTYDKTVHTVTVKVEDNDGQLAITETTLDGAACDFSKSKVEFTNEYKPSKTTVKLPVEKKIKGDKPSAEGKFGFELKAKGDAPAPAKDKVVIKGEGKTTFGEIAYDKAGTYKYTVTEINDAKAGYTYDKTVYNIEVTVKDNDGKLTAEWKANGKKVSSIKFTNTYKDNENADDQYNRDNDDGSDTEDGSSSTDVSKDKNKDKGVSIDSSQTGDESNVTLWLVLAVIAAVCLIVAIAMRFRRRRE